MTDLRVTEQGQEVEVRAGGGKRDFLSPARAEIKTAPSQDPEWSSVGFGEPKAAEKWGVQEEF